MPPARGLQSVAEQSHNDGWVASYELHLPLLLGPLRKRCHLSPGTAMSSVQNCQQRVQRYTDHDKTI
jgi:hypothetical protein